MSVRQKERKSVSRDKTITQRWRLSFRRLRLSDAKRILKATTHKVLASNSDIGLNGEYFHPTLFFPDGMKKKKERATIHCCSVVGNCFSLFLGLQRTGVSSKGGFLV